jgi:sugar-specific transcriptional regulator TrmB
LTLSEKKSTPSNLSDLERIEDELNELGLSRESAKVYVALLRTGRSPANALAKVAGIHRVDTYKKLNELTQLGFSRLILGRPTLYEPIEPHAVLESLINSKKKELELFIQNTARLEPKLRGVSSIPLIKVDDGHSAYQLVAGRQQGYGTIEKVLQAARYDVQRTVSANGLKRNYKYKLLDELIACAKRGVRVRVISNVEQVPRKIVDLLVSSIELRQVTDSLLPFIIVDGETILLSSQFNDSDMTLNSHSTRTVLIRDKKFAKLFSLVFEHFWASAKIVAKSK